jgi:hypothetical protein
MLKDKSQFSANAESEFPQIAIDFAPIDLIAGNKRKTSWVVPLFDNTTTTSD